MTLDLARHLLAHGRVVPELLAREFAASYRWSRGYGPSTAHVLRAVRRGVPWQEAAVGRHRGGSYGNGAAMRIAPVALAFHGRPTAMDDAVAASAAVTHPHPAAVAGARLVCRAIADVLRGVPAAACLDGSVAAAMGTAHEQPMRRAVAFAAGLPEPAELRRALGCGTAAVEACAPAILLGITCADRPFTEMTGYISDCGGDTDTVAAMAGALWGARRGRAALPDDLQASVEGAEDALALAAALHAVAGAGEADHQRRRSPGVEHR